MNCTTIVDIVNSIVITLVTCLLAYIAYKSMRFYKISALSNLYQNIHKEYSSKKMNKAIRHLHDYYRKHQPLYDKNRYKFAREYINEFDEKTPQWQLRRQVTHFYCHIENLLERDLLDENFVFESWSLKDLAIIKILEPIETVIWEITGSRNTDKEWGPLRLYEKAEKRFNSKQPKGRKYTLPTDIDLYDKSRI